MQRKVRDWQDSGLSMGEFANKNGFSKSNFTYWVKKFRQSEANKSVSFVELQHGNESSGALKDIVSLVESGPGLGTIVITFPGGMSVKISG